MCLGNTLLFTSGLTSTEQSAILQFSAVLMLRMAQKFGICATDSDSFSPLMLSIYFQVDLFQSFLFLKTELFSVEFFQMLALQEAFSITKNAGFFELLLWAVGLRRTLPYRDAETIRMLKVRASKRANGLGAC